MKTFVLAGWVALAWTALAGCSEAADPYEIDGNVGTDQGSGGDSDLNGDTFVGSDGDSDEDSQDGGDTDDGPSAPQYPEVWYSSGEALVHIALSAANGSVVSLNESKIAGLPIGQNCLTMLDDGSLVGARLSHADNLTYFYHVAEPPRDGRPASYKDLGIMPDEIMLEGLYTDCDGRLYGMDTGQDVGSTVGNRLLRFLGNYLEGDFTYEVISDLSAAVVADIDDMGPGIDEDGRITDNPGLAIDTGAIYDFDYVTGTGTAVAVGGTWGVHALGGELFDDGISRIYLLSSNAELLELKPGTFELSDVLVTGPATTGNYNGWSGIAGPLTDCESGFPPVI